MLKWRRNWARLCYKYFPDRPVSPSWVKSVAIKLPAIFIVEDAPRSSHSSIKTEDLQIQVLGTIAAQQKLSKRAIANK